MSKQNDAEMAILAKSPTVTKSVSAIVSSVKGDATRDEDRVQHAKDALAAGVDKATLLSLTCQKAGIPKTGKGLPKVAEWPAETRRRYKIISKVISAAAGGFASVQAHETSRSDAAKARALEAAAKAVETVKTEGVNGASLGSGLVARISALAAGADPGEEGSEELSPQARANASDAIVDAIKQIVVRAILDGIIAREDLDDTFLTANGDAAATLDKIAADEAKASAATAAAAA